MKVSECWSSQHLVTASSTNVPHRPNIMPLYVGAVYSDCSIVAVTHMLCGEVGVACETCVCLCALQGCGEHLIRTMLARECSSAMQADDAHQALLEAMQNKFISEWNYPPFILPPPTSSPFLLLPPHPSSSSLPSAFLLLPPFTLPPPPSLHPSSTLPLLTYPPHPHTPSLPTSLPHPPTSLTIKSDTVSQASVYYGGYSTAKLKPNTFANNRQHRDQSRQLVRYGSITCAPASSTNVQQIHI